MLLMKFRGVVFSSCVLVGRVAHVAVVSAFGRAYEGFLMCAYGRTFRG